MTYALKRLLETNKACEKCAALVRDNPNCRRIDASYRLISDDGKNWNLCTNHAAAASWSLGIKNRTFNPKGEINAV